jgi:hypothetical protein
MNQQTDRDSALAAMRHAAEKARERALRYGSRLAVWRNGAVMLLDPRRTKAESGPRD